MIKVYSQTVWNPTQNIDASLGDAPGAISEIGALTVADLDGINKQFASKFIIE